jgi:prepilin peptidase CpaA
VLENVGVTLTSDSRSMTNALSTYWYVILTVLLVGVAIITDLRWRRIPNVLTFSVLGVALVLRLAFEGWAGLGLAIAGALLAPGLLLLLHGGRGIGMGDLKLMAAIGAIFGPLLAVVTVFISAVTGGVLAIVWTLRPGSPVAQMLSPLLIGLPFRKKQTKEREAAATNTPAGSTIPYGVAIGVGSIITLVVFW